MAPPRSNKRISYDDEGDGFVANDGDTSDRPTKKPRKSASSTAAPIKDTEGNLYWEISRQRRVTITEFKSKTLVNVREYYEKDGKDLPGKKGIAMSIEQYCAFIELLPEIEKVLKKKGEKVPRPDYGGTSSRPIADQDVEDEEEDGGGFVREKKSNIEATSDEDEDDE